MSDGKSPLKECVCKAKLNDYHMDHQPYCTWFSPQKAYDKLQQELDAARAGLRDWKQEAEMRMYIIVRERTQLTDARELFTQAHALLKSRDAEIERLVENNKKETEK